MGAARSLVVASLCVLLVVGFLCFLRVGAAAVMFLWPDRGEAEVVCQLRVIERVTDGGPEGWTFVLVELSPASVLEDLGGAGVVVDCGADIEWSLRYTWIDVSLEREFGHIDPEQLAVSENGCLVILAAEGVAAADFGVAALDLVERGMFGSGGLVGRVELVD